MEVDLLQIPTKENEHTAICRATGKTANGGLFIDIGDANPMNCNSKVARHIIRMASTRAKARCLRDLTNIGMTCLEELGDLTEVVGAMEFGSAIHMVLAEIHQQKMVGIELSIKEIQESFEKHWTRLAKDRLNIQYAEGKSFDTFLLEGKELLSVYYHKRSKDSFQVIAVEEPFSINLEGCLVPIIGAIDLIEEDSSGTIIVTDFKTTGRAYSNDEVDRNFQLTIYQIAVKQNGFANREILLKFDCLIKTKTPKFEPYYTTRNKDDPDYFLVLINLAYHDQDQKNVDKKGDNYYLISTGNYSHKYRRLHERKFTHQVQSGHKGNRG
jgi:RecB family exonuclease